MAKPTILVLHPRAWAAKGFSDKHKCRFNYVHANIGAPVPRKRNGVPTYDGYAEVVTELGKQDMLNKVHAHKPVALLYWMHGGLNPDVMSRVRAACPKIKFIHWYSNHRNCFPKGVDKMVPGRFIDLLLMNHDHPSQIKMFRNSGLKCARFWDGFDPAEAPLEPVKQEFDCFFGGNTYEVKAQKDGRFRFPAGQLRHDFIRAVAERFNLLLHCAPAYSWKGIKSQPEVFHPHYTAAMRRAKITLNVNHFPAFRHAYTRRTIRSIFAGRCHVTLYIPGMEDHFTNYEDIVWFNEMDEGLDLIDYYLKHDKEREAIAKKCLANALENHTWVTRVHEFEDIFDRELGL